jgi:uncharacterized protein YjiS (DUF1127 family)
MSSTIKTVAPFAQIKMTFAAWIAETEEAFNTWKIVRKTRAELLSLSDRELADIGLSRADVRTMDLTPKN